MATGSNAPWQNPPTSVSGVIRPATGEGSAQGSRTSQPQLSSNPSSDDSAINDKYFDNFDLTHEFSSEILCTRSYEFKNSSDNVKGSLRAHLPFWKGIKANSFVIDIIENGYSMPFISRPPRKFNKNNLFTLDNANFVSEAVSKLLGKGCIDLVDECPDVVNPFVAFNRSGKTRLILDLHEVNMHVWKDKVKFEDFKVAMTYFKQNNFMFKFNLKSGYHHIDMAQWCCTYLGFCWEGKFYVFTVLPFGLASSPYVFTKCLRPIVGFWRNHGVHIVLNLDDGWCTNESFDLTKSDADFVFKSLSDAGFLVNLEKSVFIPTKTFTWLGLEWDSNEFSIRIPSKRITDVL